MDQQEVTVVHATEEFLKSQIAQKDERIQSLEQHVQRVTQRDYASAANLNALREGMKEWTVGQLENSDITTEQAEEIAEICGFELTKEVDVEVTVQYSFTVNVPVGEEVEDIINDISFDSIDYDTDKVSCYNVSVDRIDF
jgi:hypothetical protein